jgi:hypothetical protein
MFDLGIRLCRKKSNKQGNNGDVHKKQNGKKVKPIYLPSGGTKY